MDWKIRTSTPERERVISLLQSSPWDPPNLLFNGHRRLNWLEVKLTTHLYLVFKWFIPVVCDYNIKYQKIPGG